MIKIYNTLTRKKEKFKPMNENRVNLFVCGPTVYDNAHIGHARTYISFDVISRYLKYKGFSVFYLQNITDIDNKIIKRAAETGEDPIKLARKFEKKYIEDMKTLGVENVNLYARATEHLPEIISQIETLLSKGFAYETESGVYFDESQFPEFGKLSNRNIEDLNVHRVNPDSTKRNPGDFALWKKKDEKPFWESPWGTGRPGWHIEDTAITEEYFGPQYDLHGGGLDLIFPHHEAEIAQMESTSSLKPMVRYWMHTGFLNVKGEKMSKSLGNFITIRELLKNYSPEVFRFFVISTHYRSPIDFSQEILEQSHKGLKRIYKLAETVEDLLESEVPQNSAADKHQIKLLTETREKFLEAMDNDFNTPLALSSLFDFIREINRDINHSKISKYILNHIKIFLLKIGDILGVDFLTNRQHDDLTEELVDLITNIREKLRQKNEWELADDIRTKLGELNIIIEDKK
ncbi:cysteine--tRNA ligase [Methanobacterium petrolearium]|uniref:cysteine--tRNA ligase n=1 Tax=Methanobacterium petrolearium TaxID=710190 RepID=UPI001FD72676|nr:cysteine--tRNA ligase [Methanobacterium petrolearium]MBP1945270.1 cysteinyl-tRNA synthetase [Methanobacterium petrolearium]